MNQTIGAALVEVRREGAIGNGEHGSEQRQVSSAQGLDQETLEEAKKLRQEGREFCMEIGREGGHFHGSRRDGSWNESTCSKTSMLILLNHLKTKSLGTFTNSPLNGKIIMEIA